RAAFLQQSTAVLEAARTLGAGPWRSFFLVALPGARPAVIAGVSLAMMEAPADYGTVQYFGVSTFTTGIFRTWFGLGDSAAAAQLAAVLTLAVLVLIVLERHSRRRVRYHDTGNKHAPLRRHRLAGGRAALAWLGCALPLALGFLVPVGQLVVWAARTAERVLDDTFVTVALQTLGLAVTAALLVLVLAVVMGYGQRLTRSAAVHGAARVASLGYAI